MGWWTWQYTFLFLLLCSNTFWRTRSTIKNYRLCDPFCTVHAVLFNCFVPYRTWPIENGLPVLCFVQTLFRADVEDDTESQFQKNYALFCFITVNKVFLEATWTPLKTRNLRESKTSLMQDTTNDLLASFHACGRTFFQARNTKVQTPLCFLILISYWWDIPEAEGKSAMKHGVAVCIPCVKCFTIVDAVWSLQCDRSRTLPELKLAGHSVRLQNDTACSPASFLYWVQGKIG